MQKQKQQQNLNVVVESILAYQNSECLIPAQLVDHIIQLTETKSGRDHVSALRLKADSLFSQDKICEALTTYEAAIRQYPEDLSLQMGVSDFFVRANNRLEQIGSLEPSCAEIGRSYERLLDLGCVSLKLHLIAIKHYQSSGEISKACDLALRMYGCGPSFLGLNEAIIALSTVTDDSRIQSIARRGSKS